MLLVKTRQTRQPVSELRDTSILVSHVSLVSLWRELSQFLEVTLWVTLFWLVSLVSPGSACWVDLTPRPPSLNGKGVTVGVAVWEAQIRVLDLAVGRT